MAILPPLTNASEPVSSWRLAAFSPGGEVRAPSGLPRVLSRGDAARYERIFALQQHEAWHEADREIARLKDRLLLGHVLAQRYLGKGCHSSYAELADWLRHYADEPDAKAIYELALARKPAGAKPPRGPVTAARLDRMADDDADDSLDGATLSPHAALVARQIRTLVATSPQRAETLLASAEAKRTLDPHTWRALRAAIARVYPVNAAASPAAAAAAAVPPEPELSPMAHWEAGLEAWRRHRPSEAWRHFEAVARTAGSSTWLRSAGAFWAARAALRLRKRALMTHWLRKAAEEPRTFYGLIARRLLGVGTDFDFEAEPFTALDARVMIGIDAGRRALALVQIDERGRAAAELHALAAGNNPALLQSIAGLADRADLPALSLRLAGMLAETDGRGHDHALYPVPRWQPQGGFTVDRALLFALMRQESLFVPQVTSAAGARGLMQLMPTTALEVAERNGLSLGAGDDAADASKALADPEINLTLAQEYVHELLDDRHIHDNLMLFALAYNQGPATVQRWADLAKEDRRDPLLFLESVPSQQARVFTKHVLTNYWIYRQRLGQPTDDLGALAEGKWPTYTALDQSPDDGGRYAAN